MASVIEIEGKNFLPIREANRLVSYSRDYITRLAREEKINAVQVGRQWYVDGDSLQEYEVIAQAESEIRKQQLSQQRKHEREIREAAERRLQQHDNRLRSMHVRSTVAAAFVLFMGVLSGQVAYHARTTDTFNVSLFAGGGFLSEKASVAFDAFDTNASPAVEEHDRQPAVIRSVDSIVATATTSQTVIDEQSRAVVLLPQGVATTTDLFSDEVQVRVASGTAYVELVDESGEVIGDSLPYISVPVARSSTSHTTSVHGSNFSSS